MNIAPGPGTNDIVGHGFNQVPFEGTGSVRHQNTGTRKGCLIYQVMKYGQA